MKNNMFFSVIIPTYHRNDLLAKCLGRLAPGNQLLSKDEYEVIVTDDGIETTSEQMIHRQFALAQWVKGPGKGPAANRNNGAKHARGNWLVFTDDDCIPDLGWLGAYKNALQENTEINVFEGRIYADRERQSLAERAPINDKGGLLWTSNMCIQKDLFENMNGFDESFRYAFEDVDFAYRVRKKGERFIFCPEASVCHPWRAWSALEDEWKKSGYFQESLLLYLNKHPEERRKYTSAYYLKDSLRNFIRLTVPGCARYHGRGLREVLLYHLHMFKIAWILMPNYFMINSEKNTPKR